MRYSAGQYVEDGRAKGLNDSDNQDCQDVAVSSKKVESTTTKGQMKPTFKVSPTASQAASQSGKKFKE